MTASPTSTPRSVHSGSGPTLVFLHGWGLHSGVWRGLAETLDARYRVTLLDLPGHGYCPMIAGDYTLAALATAVEGALPERSTLIGWSLGGLVALMLALERPDRIRRLILVGSSPRFTADADWPCAMQPEVLDAFAQQLQEDHAGTIRRFLALQALGSEDARRTLTQLKAEIAAAPTPDPRALAGGLAILRGTSLLPRLPEIRVPVTLIHGERDTLAPLAAAQETAARLPDARLHVIAGAGHAPFLSHADEFRRLLLEETAHD